jgi:hypothetical protein
MWPPQTILVSDELISLKKKISSPRKPLCQMNRNLVGRSSIKIAYFVQIHELTWPLQAILVSDWSISNNLLLGNSLGSCQIVFEAIEKFTQEDNKCKHDPLRQTPNQKLGLCRSPFILLRGNLIQNLP